MTESQESRFPFTPDSRTDSNVVYGAVHEYLKLRDHPILHFLPEPPLTGASFSITSESDGDDAEMYVYATDVGMIQASVEGASIRLCTPQPQSWWADEA